ncbi:hypothetical protein [Chryseolinea sp. H1M3-3]|uniref:hypothetical protein n=1 Tax=Chryseolinea sp. H1M3-3 TaxID=3034144 RepID=UPI0023EB187C|nr:hypothetical protein [Chryseolinea sp. H1M3-3]
MEKQELELRIKNAIILLSNGHPFEVGDLTLGTRDKNHFSVTGWSVNNDLKNITKESAIKEMNEIKDLFKRMTLVSKDLSSFIENKKIEYHLRFDYGMGAIGICTEKDGRLEWETDLSW